MSAERPVIKQQSVDDLVGFFHSRERVGKAEFDFPGAVEKTRRVLENMFVSGFGYEAKKMSSGTIYVKENSPLEVMLNVMSDEDFLDTKIMFSLVVFNEKGTDQAASSSYYFKSNNDDATIFLDDNSIVDVITDLLQQLREKVESREKVIDKAE